MRQDSHLVRQPATSVWARQGYSPVYSRQRQGPRHHYRSQGRLPRIWTFRQRSRRRATSGRIVECSQCYCDSRRRLRWSDRLRTDRLCLYSQRFVRSQDVCPGWFPDARRQRIPRRWPRWKKRRGCRCRVLEGSCWNFQLLQDKGPFCRCVSRRLCHY